MTRSEPRLFDFREIAAWDDTVTSLRTWVSKAGSFFGDCWQDLTGSSARLVLGETRTESYGRLLSSLSEEYYCCLLKIDPWTITTMLYASHADLKLAIAHMLGASSKTRTGPAEPADPQEPSESLSGEDQTSSLSHVELSLVELVFEELGRCLQEAWIGTEEIGVSVAAIEHNPGKTRVFRTGDLVTKTSLEIELTAGPIELGWLLPKQPTCDLLETIVDNRAAPSAKQLSEQLAGKLPIELVAVLGKAAVPMSRLSKLQVGELIMLDQRIDSPLSVQVNHRPLFQCWPGRLGNAQALEVSQCLDE